jgi:hypothetical protein
MHQAIACGVAAAVCWRSYARVTAPSAPMVYLPGSVICNAKQRASKWCQEWKRYGIADRHMRVWFIGNNSA